MIALINWLVMGHTHKWKTLEVVPIRERDQLRGDAYIQQCEKCGHVRRVDLD